MKDNKDEQFPVVDEMGNIVGVISRGHAHDGSKILHPVVYTFLIIKAICFSSIARLGRIFNLTSGIQLAADMSI